MNQDMTLEMSVQEFELDSNMVDRKFKRQLELNDYNEKKKQASKNRLSSQ